MDGFRRHAHRQMEQLPLLDQRLDDRIGRATSYPRSAGSASATGFLKSGWANGGAGLFSPKMEAVGSEAKDVTVELTLAGWTLNNKPDNDQLCIRVLGGGTIGNASSTEQVFSVGSWNEWTVHEFEIFGATAATQIYIGSTIEANNRWFIDRFRLIYITEKPRRLRTRTHDRPRIARIHHRRRRQAGEGDGQRRMERPQRSRMAVVRPRGRRRGNFDGDDLRRTQPDGCGTPRDGRIPDRRRGDRNTRRKAERRDDPVRPVAPSISRNSMRQPPC